MSTEILRVADGFAGKRVTVFGQGPLGLFAAFALASNGAEVRVRATQLIAEGTGFRHAAGLLEPVATDDERVAGWFAQTVSFFGSTEQDRDWGVKARSVLLLSDRPEVLQQDWISQVPWRPASVDEIAGRARFGIWFDTFVVQPNVAISAIERELERYGIDWHRKKAVGRTTPTPVRSIKDAARLAARADGSDAFVLALGLGMAGLTDIELIAEADAGLSAGLGLTIRMPWDGSQLDHVIMDADNLGYLIPQSNQIVVGGTNVVADAADRLTDDRQVPDPDLMARWEEEVRDKVAKLRPDLDFADGRIQLGARPLRPNVLTAVTNNFEIPGVAIGGAGGSGWTLSVGIANDTAQICADLLGCSAPRELAVGVPSRRPG